MRGFKCIQFLLVIFKTSGKDLPWIKFNSQQPKSIFFDSFGYFGHNK